MSVFDNVKKFAALAPMASIADKAYRQICSEYGAIMTTSEMISAKGLVYRDKKTAAMCQGDKVPDSGVYALQFFGSEPDIMAEAICMLPDVCGGVLPDIIDINMGCPVPKVVGNGCGSALMKVPNLAAAIMNAAVRAAEKLGIPVTAKIRAGFDKDHINAVEFAIALESAGAQALTVHPRTREQFYSGLSDWDIIRKVKNKLNIPVIGNGDIKTPEDAKRMYDETGCDLIMIGRGSYGKPWLFKQIKEFLTAGAYTPGPDNKSRAEMMLHQVELAVKYKGEERACKEARTICGFYVKGLPGAAELRRRCAGITSLNDVLEIVEVINNL
jgi:tRNA-dihydrouridine synthase B